MSAAAGADRRLRVVLCWHMHQPVYRDLVTGEFAQPWTYLHGIKDYVDMAQHLEAVPGACAVVNFAPTLLEQIDDYSAALGAWLARGTRIPDPLLAALADGAPAPSAAIGARAVADQVCWHACVYATTGIRLGCTLLEVGKQARCGQAEQQRNAVNRLAEGDLKGRNFGERRVDKTFRLDDVEARSSASFELQACQFQCFATRGQVLAGDRDALLIIARVDIGRNDAGQEG